ncbi:MAG: zf-HC2 domain-containing protein, partial [bacterium]
MPQHIPLKKLFDHQQGIRSDEYQTIENHLAGCEHCTENMSLFSPHRRAQETKLAKEHQREPANGKQADEREDGCPPPEQIDRFINNALPKRQLHEVEKHLAICDACRRQLIAAVQYSFEPVSEEEKELLEALPPFEISEQVRQITNATPPPSGRFSSLIRRLSGWLDSHIPELRVPRPAWAVALVLALGLVGIRWAWPTYQYYRLASQGESQLLEQNKIFYKGELRPAQGYVSSGEAEIMSPESEKQIIDAVLK